MRRMPGMLVSSCCLSALLFCLLFSSNLALAAVPDRIASPLTSRQTIPLAKSVHPYAQAENDRGPVDPAFKLSYVTLLAAPSASQHKALTKLLAQQQDRQSPLYHKWLTPQQYAERFGLSQNDLTKIATWLTSEGFQILSVGGGHNSVVFSGTAADVERAFGTQMHTYVRDGVEHYSNASPITLPAALQGIVASVIGLHDFRPVPANRGRLTQNYKTRPDYYDANFIFPNFLAPGDIATIYDLTPLYNAGIDGTGQKLAVVGQTDVYLDDINDFRSGFGLSTISCTTNGSGVITACNDPHFKYVLNGNTDPGVNSNGDDLPEADLDLEWSGATARNAQIVYVNSGATNGGVYDALSVAINPPSGPPLGTVISMSYGFCEVGAPDLETVLQQGNSEGVTIVNSSGDTGSAACDFNPPSPGNQPFLGAQFGIGVSYPASSQYVTGVGGSSISLANDSYPTQSAFWSTTIGANGGTAQSYIPENAWNEDEELALYCHSPAHGDTFCASGGGTTGWVALTSSATGQQVQEDIWLSMGGGGASNCWYVDGSGICLGAGVGPTGGAFPQPTYQQALVVAGAPSGVRYVPDVSMFGSPDFPGYVFCTAQNELVGGSVTTSSCSNGIFTSVDTYQSLVGGTSVGAPVFAGIVALLNQDVVQSGIQSTPGLGNINPTLYTLAAQSQAQSQGLFHQITTGDNLAYCQPGLPAGFPANVVCPAAVAPSTQGVFGFQASNKDSATGYNLVTGLGSVDGSKLAAAWVATALSATTTTLVSSQNPANFGASVTFTATVTTTGTNPPTGTVTFKNGTATMGTGTLSTVSGSQVATFATATLPSGSNSITAVYGGDTNNGGSTSAVLTQNITAPTFNLSTPTTPSPVLAGLPTTSTFTVTPTGTGVTQFAGTVTFACSGLPDATVSCAFNPATIAAGQPATPVTLTITTSGPNQAVGAAQRKHRADNRSPWLPLTLPLAAIVGIAFGGRKLSGYSKLGALCVSLALLGVLVACGGGSSAPPAVSVSVSAGSPASVFPNSTGWSPTQTAQFTATVSNSTNTAVTWAVTTANGGTIDANGLYTAPTIAAGLPSSVVITATSSADPTKSGTGHETLTPATVPGTYPNIMVTATESTTVHSGALTLTVQ